jgi:protein ImuA
MSRESETTREIVRSLQERLRSWERDHRGPVEVVSSGCPALDRLLAERGFCRGTLVEWLAAGEKGDAAHFGNEPRPLFHPRRGSDGLAAGRGSGAATLALAIAARACREAGALVVVDRPRMFYPPAAAGLGIDWSWFVVVRPQSERDEAWALDQVLRSAGVGSVLCWPRKLGERRFRQIQLAAEAGGTLGLIVRPEQARDEPSWAEVRLLVTPAKQRSEVGDRRSEKEAQVRSTKCEVRKTAATRRLRVEVIRSRGGAQGTVELELDEQTGALYEPSAVDLASRLAAPAAGGRSTGA